jgi:UTP-glucose-1-phosphate uridylyltransferase/mevalonate kinase
MDLFVPGRICLFGEHTDWAGHYRRINGELEKGYTIISGTNQGIYANVQPHPNRLIVRTHILDQPNLDIPMNCDSLLEVAECGGFYSYIAGVAYQVLTHYRVRGLKIHNYKTDLPIQKGLSSSAAICVLTARAFNRIYDLKMTTRGEMEFAYLGEITTPSRCGRMDQGCAYGIRPVLMTFDGDRLDVREIKVKKDLYYVIVDLHAGKDTKKILAQLNQAFPFAQSDLHKCVQQYLGPISKRITHQAIQAIDSGATEQLGHLMTEAQKQFDAYLQPACPEELSAPILHTLLAYEPIQPYILGGKGVGSQGDGSAQLLMRDEESQKRAIAIIEADLGMTCLSLTIQAAKRIRKAIIPAAGFGAHHFPASKALKMEFLPVIDQDGKTKPAILANLEELIRAGIEDIAIIIQPSDQELFESFFCIPPPIEGYNQLSREDQLYNEQIQEWSHRITFIHQPIQDGFGHAVLCAKDWIKDEPFLLMLGDHLFRAKEGSCTQQLMDQYEQFRKNIVGLKETGRDDIRKYGVVAGKWEIPHTLLHITEATEKPNWEYAHHHLAVEGIENDCFLSFFGLYILFPRVLEILEEQVSHNLREQGLFQLTPALNQLRQEEELLGYCIDGERFDLGSPDKYYDTFKRYNQPQSKKRP